jgi:hypothetical protein
MRSALISLAAVAALGATAGAWAQTGGNMTDQEQQLIAQIQTDKRAVVLSAMNLTDAEVAAFIPVYDEYQGDMKKVYTHGTDLLNRYASNYDTMTDDAAKSLLKEIFKQRDERAKLLQKYAKQMSGKLPATKVLRFVQVETRLNTLLDWQAAQVIPLAK